MLMSENGYGLHLCINHSFCPGLKNRCFSSALACARFPRIRSIKIRRPNVRSWLKIVPIWTQSALKLAQIRKTTARKLQGNDHNLLITLDNMSNPSWVQWQKALNIYRMSFNISALMYQKIWQTIMGWCHSNKQRPSAPYHKPFDLAQ